MGVMPIGKLLLSMGLPMVLSMLVQALYNIVDSVFVAKVSEAALTSVSMAFPIQNFMIASVSGMGVGVNALLSRSLGEGNTEEANRAANNGIFLSFMTMIIFILFGIFGSRAFFAFQTSNKAIIKMGAMYVRICCIGSFGCFGQIIFERLLQATGQAHLSMITQMTGAIINIILDPIMIFGLLGCPEMGIAGAALATVIGQIVACVTGLLLNIFHNKALTISPRYRPNGRIIGEIYRVGIPSIAMQSIGSIMNMAMNMILMGFTSTATAVFGVSRQAHQPRDRDQNHQLPHDRNDQAVYGVSERLENRSGADADAAYKEGQSHRPQRRNAHRKHIVRSAEDL